MKTLFIMLLAMNVAGSAEGNSDKATFDSYGNEVIYDSYADDYVYVNTEIVNPGPSEELEEKPISYDFDIMDWIFAIGGSILFVFILKYFIHLGDYILYEKFCEEHVYVINDKYHPMFHIFNFKVWKVDHLMNEFDRFEYQKWKRNIDNSHYYDRK